MIGLIISVVLNSYTFYEFGYQSTTTTPTECPYNHELFKQSIAGIFTGFFAAQLLVILLAIPSTAPTNNAGNHNYKSAILLFILGFIITAGLTILSVYHFVDSRVYGPISRIHHLDSCSQFYYNTVFANTILSAIPVCVISICYILYMISWGLDTVFDKCYVSTYNQQPRTNKQTQTRKRETQRQTQRQQTETPQFINPSAESYIDTDTTSIGSSEKISIFHQDDEFQMDALEINPVRVNQNHNPNLNLSTTETAANPQFYPSRKYNYSATTDTNEQPEDTIPLLIHNYK